MLPVRTRGDGGAGARRGRRTSGIERRPDGLKYLTPRYARAFLGLVRAGETLDRALDAELSARHSLTLRAFEVLLFLAVFSARGSMRMSDLIAQAPLSQSRVSRLVAELEARGLVERRGVADDARAWEVTITPLGLKTFRAAQDTHLDQLDRRLFSRLSSAEIDQLGSITAKILDADG